MIGINWINFIRFALPFLLVVGCTSKVSETELSSDVAVQTKATQSAVQLLEAVGKSDTATCSPKNKIRLLVTQNSGQPIKCRDNTQLASGLSVGAVCPSGVSITNFTANTTAWTDCATMKVCGQAAKTSVDLTSSPGTKMQQLEFSDLPWGCTGNIEWAYADQVNNANSIQKIELNMTPPPCPLCATTGARTCEICGTDAVKPVIVDVIGEVAACNQIKVTIFAEDKESGLHRDAYSFDGGTTWQSSSENIYTGMNLDLAADQIRVRDRAGNIAIGTRRVQVTAPPCPCDAPWGERIPHGESRTTFKVGSVTCAQNCESQSITRTCTNGVLSGDVAYKFNACKIEGCPKCNLPWGEQISHGESVTAYEKPNVTCADQCKSTVLKCDRGSLVGNGAAFPAKACAYAKPKCNCEFAGVIIPDGGSKSVYASAQVNCGQTCTAGTVTCTQGALSGNTNMTSLSCSAKECKCTTSWGQKINLNDEVDAYKVNTVSCSQNIICSDSSNKIKIKCVNTETNQLTVSQGTGNIADFNQQSCNKPVCGCTHLGVQFKPSDQPLTVYRFDKAVPPATCSGQGNFGTVKCTQSGTTYTVTGDINTSIYKYTLCEDPPGGGKSSENVGPGSGGGTGGGVGNDDGEGEGFKRRGKGGGGKGCDINAYPYVCADKQFKEGSDGKVLTISTGTPGACMVPDLEGSVIWPTDKTDITRRVEGNTFIAGYSKKTVACGDSCSKYIGYIDCGLYGWANLDKYPYQDCKEVCP